MSITFGRHQENRFDLLIEYAIGQSHRKLRLDIRQCANAAEQNSAATQFDKFHRKAIAGGIKDAQMMANYGGSLEALGDHEGAILANKQALELNPTLVDVAMATASQLNSLGRPGEAAQLLQSFDDRQVAMGAKAHFEPIIKIMKENAEATAQQPAAN